MAGHSPGARGHYEQLCIIAIGQSVIIPARGPRQRAIANSFFTALFARRTPP